MKLCHVTEEISFPETFELFCAPSTVQSGTVRTFENYILIESSGRFKRFPVGTEHIKILEGNGHIKWKRGDLPFTAGDTVLAEGLSEYDFYGTGRFLVLKD